MSDTIIQTIITALAVMVTGGITGLITGSKVIYRIDQLEKKVDTHNKLIERMAVVETDIKAVHYRINELREEGEKA